MIFVGWINKKKMVDLDVFVVLVFSICILFFLMNEPLVNKCVTDFL